MADRPLFSFVVPVYGTEKYLPRCLDSIFAQTAKNYEVIVIDDCSPGNVQEICERYDKCRYVRHKVNKGLLQARLTGLHFACGIYVIPVDSDDYILSEVTASLEKMVRKFDSPEVISYGIEKEIDKDSLFLFSIPDTGEISCHEALRRMLGMEFLWSVIGKVFKTDTYRQAVKRISISRLKLNVAEDLIQSVAILLCGGRFVSCSYIGYRYVYNGSSLTNDLRSRDAFLSHITDTIKSLSFCDRLLSVYGGEFDELYCGVKRQIIRWNLEALRNADRGEWSFRIDCMCKMFRDAKLVFSEFLEVDRIWNLEKEADIIRDACDKTYSEKGAAWAAHDAVAAERDEVWKKLEASYAELEVVRTERDAIAADRDKAYSEKAEAWKAYDAVVADRDNQAMVIRNLNIDVRGLCMELKLSKQLNDSLGAELKEIRQSLVWKMVRPIFRLVHK